MKSNFFAALIFFTRLPFWRFIKVPDESFKHVVPYWPVVGWLTGSLTAGMLWLAAHILSFPVAVLVAIIFRLLITGALHEDGLADCCDGFGGGKDREGILRIMKDSHIGSYGVIGLVLYFLLLWSLLKSMTLSMAVPAIIAADVWSKFSSSQIIDFLPYARKEEESKAGVVYQPLSVIEFFIGLAVAIPAVFCLLPIKYWPVCIFPFIVLLLFVRKMKHKIGGYTGDCCGALFLLSELAFYLGINLLTTIYLVP